MSRKFTKRNKQGIRTKSTLLDGLKKIKMYHRQATANVNLTKTYDKEGTLNKMAMWLMAVEKCPPRHYGKVWNDEKQKLVEQCRRMYLEAQRLSHITHDSFMGDHRGDKKRDGEDGDGRFMPLSRLKWNMATAKWDFTNRPTIGSNPYWNADQAKRKRPVRTLKGAEKDQAYEDYCENKNPAVRDTEDAMRKVVQITNGKTVFNESPFSEWKQNYKPMKDNKGYHVGYY